MQIQSDFEFLIKLVVIGDSGIGKTNFIFRFTEDKFSIVHVATVGFDYKSKIINLPNTKKKIKLQIWDTAGQERYMAINRNIFQRVQGIILMYDITDRDSFDHLSRWIDLINKNVSNKPYILVGNKLDLANEKRIIEKEEGEKVAMDNNVEFFEGSGRSGENVDKIFTYIADKVYKHLMEERNDSMEKNISINSGKAKNKKCC